MYISCILDLTKANDNNNNNKGVDKRVKYTIDKAHERERTKKIKQMYANQQKISDKRMLKHFKEELEKVQNDLEYFERDYYIKSYKNAIKELKNKL